MIFKIYIYLYIDGLHLVLSGPLYCHSELPDLIRIIIGVCRTHLMSLGIGR